MAFAPQVHPGLWVLSAHLLVEMLTAEYRVV